MMIFENAAIFGATGKVGLELLQLIENNTDKFKNIRVFASNKNTGNKVSTNKKEYILERVSDNVFEELDIAFFCVGSDFSKKYKDIALKNNVIVIDNSSAFRMSEEIPLIIPEINPEKIKGNNYIANPNCTTAIAAIPLFEIHKRYNLNKVIISSYQAASGAGKHGMDELIDNTKRSLRGECSLDKVFQYNLAFNVIPHIDEFTDNGYTKEEMKVSNEIKKIFGIDNIKISVTAVRVPVLRSHSEAITVDTEKNIEVEELKRIFEKTKGITLKDNKEKNVYPMPLTSTNKFDVEVGRIRKSLIFDNGIDFFVSGDQLLKGAALNAYQIALNI